MKRYAVRLAVVVLSLGTFAWGQKAISAKAGLIHLAEGDVFLNDAPVALKATDLTDIKKGQVLRTAEGRAEVLLAPGSFLRLPENSAIRMDANFIEDVRVEVLSGDALVEIVEILDNCSLTLTMKGASLTVVKPGLYRLSEDPLRMQVYEGEAAVQAGSQQWTLKGGKEVASVNGVWAQSKFDARNGDGLYRWAKRRSGYIAMANVAAARQARLSSGGMLSSTWMYNPYFGMWTYLPYRGSYYSPFGYRWWSPVTVVQAYTAPPAGGGGGGGSSRGFTPSFDSSLGYSVTGGRGYGGSYGGSSGSMGSAPAASAPSAPVGDTGGARGASGSGAEGGARGGGGGGRGN